MVKNVFVVVSSAREDIFWESFEGALVYFHSAIRERNGPPVLFQTEDMGLPSSFTILDWEGPLCFQEIPYVELNRKAPLYEVPVSWSVKVYVTISSGKVLTQNHSGVGLKKMVSLQVLDFFLRYRKFREVMDSGDFLTAAHMLVHSHKLRPFLTLLKHLEGPQSNLPLVWYYLHDHDEGKQGAVRNFLEKRMDGVSSDYLRLFETACSLGDCSSFQEFERESYNFIQQHLAVGGLRVPVVGLPFHQHALLRYIKDYEKLDQHLIREVLEKRSSSREYHARCLDLMNELLPIRIVSECINSHDPNAMAVLGTTFNGIDLHLGYVKRELAAILSETDTIYSVMIACLEEENLEIIIGRNYD